jgi:uncharacterized protein
VKLQAERAEGSNAILRHSPQGVVVNGHTFTDSLILPWQGVPRPWGVSAFEDLSEAHFTALAQQEAGPPELVLFGSGPRQRFAHPRLLSGLMAIGIGVECMDTPAACRTYNVLLQEGRRVVVALLFTAIEAA